MGVVTCRIVDIAYHAASYLSGTEIARKLGFRFLALGSTGELIVGALVISSLEISTIGTQSKRWSRAYLLSLNLPSAILINQLIVSDHCASISNGIANRSSTCPIIDIPHRTVSH